MDLGLRGKKIIINGGSRGIGRAALEVFAQEGCDIAFFSRDRQRVEETVAKLRQSGGKVIGEAFDMNDAEAYKAWLKEAAERLGGCDIFIHNASCGLLFSNSSCLSCAISAADSILKSAGASGAASAISFRRFSPSGSGP